ncbi:hypothetical protein F4861DRAFT_323254 [Xylaria intraflava]|nr:hypothetical protein F4861DRAFT_323254 [Xylaria intraflava]
MQAITAILTFVTMITALQIPTPMTPPSTNQPLQISSPTAPATPIIPYSTAPARSDFVADVASAASAAPDPTPASNPTAEGTQILYNGEKFVQTTYWTCVPFPKETHCGWHAPILDTSSATTLSSHKGARRAVASIAAACILTGFILVL